MGNYTQIEAEFNKNLNDEFERYKASHSSIHPNEMQRVISQLIFNKSLELRTQKMKDLFDYTSRNVICYFSTWLQGIPYSNNPELMINDNDMNGLMNAVSKLDSAKGLDLILQTPGGIVTATESIVKYLRKVFKNNIRVIVPHTAMSAGTMIACASKAIIMGDHSSLGPVDPQYRGVPAQGVLNEFNRAVDETKLDPSRSLVWREIIRQYRPTFIGDCQNVVELSNELVKNWLSTCMFNKCKDKNKRIEKIMKELASHSASKVHDRHYCYASCKDLGLKVIRLEDDSILQDKVLSIYHTYILSAYRMPETLKYIENHLGQTLIISGHK